MNNKKISDILPNVVNTYNYVCYSEYTDARKSVYSKVLIETYICFQELYKECKIIIGENKKE